jgi:hypothetical protein
LPHQSPHCFVTELVPVRSLDWISLRNHIQQRWPNKHWLDAIIDAVPGMPTVPPWGTGNLIKWFSEYEFLGNWALTQRPCTFQWQRRFEYDTLDKIQNFTADYNCFADAVPDLSQSLQMDWTVGRVVEFDRYVNLISQWVKL